MGISYAVVLLYAGLIIIGSASPLRLPLLVPKNLPRADASSDPSCPDGFFCERSDCPSDVICPEGEECVNFEGHYACALPKLTWCALNPSNLEAVGCDDGSCCHGNCYNKEAICCDFPAIKCTIGELCNACSKGQKCGDNECINDSNPTSTTKSISTTESASSTSTTVPPVDNTTPASTTDSTSTSTDTTSTTSTSSTTSGTDSATTTGRTTSSSSSGTSSSTSEMSSTSSTSTTPTTRTPTTSGQPTPTIVSDIDDFSAMDCLADNPGNRILVGDDDSSSEMTPNQCVKLAQNGGWRYAGVEYSSQCFVGNTIHTTDRDSTDGCDMPCSGDKEQLCGGEDHIQIYKDSTWEDPTLEELADAIREYNASIALTREAILTYYDHLTTLQELMDSLSNTHVKRDDSQFQDIEMQVRQDQGALNKASDSLASARSNGRRLLQLGRQLDTINEEEPYVPFTALDDFESTALDLMEQLNNVIQDLDYNLAELASAITSGIQPAIEVSSSLVTCQTAITVIGSPIGAAVGVATGMFLVMTSLLALFDGGSGIPPSTTSCTMTAITTPVVILTKTGTSLLEFKELIASFPVDEDAIQFTEKWQPNFMYAGIIDVCTAQKLAANPVVASWAVDAEVDIEGFSTGKGDDSDSGSTKRSTRAPSSGGYNVTVEEVQRNLLRRGVPTDNSAFVQQSPSPGQLQWLSAISRYTALDGPYYAFDDLIYNNVAQGQADQPIIYIIDNGFDNTHPEFADRVIAKVAIDLRTGKTLGPQRAPSDQHGTCMTSLAGGKYAGMGKNARIVTVDIRVNISKGPQLLSRVLILLMHVLHHAQDNNGLENAVVSMSISIPTTALTWRLVGMDPPNPHSNNIFDIALNWYWANGIATVTSSGNTAARRNVPAEVKDLSYALPRALGSATNPLIVVGNAQADGTRNPASNFRDSKNLGILSIYNIGNVECADLNGNWDIGSGTSVATALTAGLMAYYISQPDLKAQFAADGQAEFAMNVKQYLIDTATQYKGTWNDGVPRAASGDVVRCADGMAGRPTVQDLRGIESDHTLKTTEVTQGTKVVVDPLPACWDLD
ncbi:hypothetical protein BJX70DRAFT_378887 [Aspergillus crustosus]